MKKAMKAVSLFEGFPDGWTEGFSDSVRYRMLGNAVTVNVAEWIARRLMAHIGNEKSEVDL